MKVELIAHTPNPEKVVAAAAKLCYSSSSIEDLMEGLTTEKAKEFVQMLSTLGHESPVEHASFTFAIEGVSRSLLAQITRHRHASFSVQSQRYVELQNFTYITPPEIAADANAKAAFEEVMEEEARQYERLTEILKATHEKAFIANGMEAKAAKKAAQKKAIEDARFVLPNACDTKMIVTMNARGLYNFFHHRCCNRAQWEIQELAKEMYKLVYKAAPALFSAAGPACLGGRCPEGKMCCGRMVEMQETYAALRMGI